MEEKEGGMRYGVSLTSKMQSVAECASSKSCQKKKKKKKQRTNSFASFFVPSHHSCPLFSLTATSTALSCSAPLLGHTAGWSCSRASSQQDWLQQGAQLISPTELISSGFAECVAPNEGVLHCVGSNELMHPSGMGSPQLQTLLCLLSM